MRERSRWCVDDFRMPLRSYSRSPGPRLAAREGAALDEMPDFLPEDDDFEDMIWGTFEDECVGCDIFRELDDLGLCEDCSAKLDRDMIRQRHWDYSTAFLCTPEEREELREEIIHQYGAKLELVGPAKPPRPKGGNKKKKKKRKG